MCLTFRLVFFFRGFLYSVGWIFISDESAQYVNYNDVTRGVKEGQSASLTAKNLPKIGKKREEIKKKREKEGQNLEKEEKSGRFFQFAPPDR